MLVSLKRRASAPGRLPVSVGLCGAVLLLCGCDDDYLPQYRFHGLCELTELEKSVAYDIAQRESEWVWDAGWGYSEQEMEVASQGAYQGALMAAERMICVRKGVIPFEDAAGY